MSFKSNNGFPILGWSASNWHLLRRKPDNIPKTHRYEEISHEEFRLLSRYLDVYRSLGKIIVTDALSTVILPRLTGLEVEQSGWRERGKYEYDTIPKDLGENDHVLVAYSTVSGMYVQYSYAKADPAKFREIVVTGIIEPKNVTNPPPSRLMVIAEHVRNNQQRIAEAQRLLTSEFHQDDESLKKLIDKFKKQNESELAEIQISLRTIDDTLARMQDELLFLQRESKENNLLLQIDKNLGLDEEGTKILQGRIEAIMQNITQHQNMIGSLGTLKEYLLAPRKEERS